MSVYEIMGQEQRHSSRSKSRLSPLDRLLSLATEVHPGEAALALLLALDVCLLMTSYYVIKPVREGFILSEGSAENKSYTAAGLVLILSLTVPLYSKLTDQLRRQILIPAVTAFFIGGFILFYFAAEAELKHLGTIFYLFVGVFNLMLVAQFWSFSNDLYTKEQGERLFPVVAFGGSIGAVLGSGVTSLLVDMVGLNQMLLVAAGILGVTILITRLVEHRFQSTRRKNLDSSVASDATKQKDSPSKPTELSDREPESTGGHKDEGDKGKKGAGAFALILRSKYLLLIAGLMFLTNLVNTTGEFILSAEVKEWAVEQGGSVEDTIGQFYGQFFFWVNLCGVVVQFFLVARAIRFLGVHGTLLVLPIIALGSYVSFALVPTLALLRIVKTAENTTDYSLNNTVRNALFLPLSKDEKYKAKQAVDTFSVRGGDLASAGVVALGIHVFEWKSRSGYAWFNVAAVGLWLVLAFAIGRHYKKLDGDGESAKKEDAR